MLDNGKIDMSAYDTYNDLFRKEIERQREQNKIDRANGLPPTFPRNMSLIAVDRTSPSICTALYLGYAADLYTRNDIANHLGIKLNKVDGFLREAAIWNN